MKILRIRLMNLNSLRGEHVELQPAGVGGTSHAMFEGVARLATVSELPASRWRARSPGAWLRPTLV